MKLVKKVLNKLNGLYYSQEYLCIRNESFDQPLHAYLLNNGQVIKDFTSLHCFVGYCPLVLAVPSSLIPFPAAERISLSFSQKILYPNGVLASKDAIARLSLKKIREQSTSNDSITYYEGQEGEHHFVTPFQQYILQLYNRLYQQKPGNVFLQGNLYKQVQIAYSIPRNISLITVGHDNKFNLFPTDLHGPVGKDHYLISLRQEGKACEQVTATRKLLLTQVDSVLYKTVYALGKNHMQPLKAKESFPFGNQHSLVLQLPLPQSALFYRELELQDSFMHGIHRIMLFRILYQQEIQQNSAGLAHIHNVYATWRHNHRLPGNYLLR